MIKIAKETLLYLVEVTFAKIVRTLRESLFGTAHD